MPSVESFETFSDSDAAGVIQRAVRLVLILAAVGTAIAWRKGGWQSAALLLVGAAISASGLWGWKRLMAALMVRMEPAEGEYMVGAHRPSIGFALVGFFLRLFVVLAVLYGSLKYLNGSVWGLAAGLLMGVVALIVESLRLLRNGTM